MKGSILNVMTGNSWRFERFENITAVNSNEIRSIGN